MKEKLIAIRGNDKLFYTHDTSNESFTKRMGYISKSNSKAKLEVDVDIALSHGYWEPAPEVERKAEGKSTAVANSRKFVEKAES